MHCIQDWPVCHHYVEACNPAKTNTFYIMFPDPVSFVMVYWEFLSGNMLTLCLDYFVRSMQDYSLSVWFIKKKKKLFLNLF